MSNRQVDEVGLVMLKAANLLEERGHCKLELEDEKGRMCIRGALITAGSDAKIDTRQLLKEAETRMGFPWINENSMYLDAVKWNNAPERTCSEVVERLRTCAWEK